MLNGLALVFSFVWREYTIVTFKFTPLSVILHSIHFIVVALSLGGFFIVFNRTLPDEAEVQEYLNKVGDCTSSKKLNGYIFR